MLEKKNMEIDEVSEAVGSLDITEKVSNIDNIVPMIFTLSLSVCPKFHTVKSIGSRALL